MIFLDTHVVVFLAGKQIEKLPKKCKSLIENNPCYISPIVLLELKYLFKIGRLKQSEYTIFSYLKNKIGLEQSQTPFDNLVFAAMDLDWTRDLFDRLIVADCIVNGAKLITKDTVILDHFTQAIWDS